MRRVEHRPRPDAVRLAQSLGLGYAEDPDGGPAYWHEGHAYELEPDEVEQLERLTEEAHRMCVEASAHLLDRDPLWASLDLPDAARDLLRHSLATQADASLYGRFDLAWDGWAPPRVLEYNADTPAGLVEAAVVQWDWLEWAHPDLDQWNLLHERLVKTWGELGRGAASGRVHLAAGAGEPTEDWCTVAYLADTARLAGLDPVQLTMEELGLDPSTNRFVDLDDRAVDVLFAMYPWEWMLVEPFADRLFAADVATRFVEPAWKCLPSSKTILVALHEIYPDHPSVLPATLGEPGPWQGYVAKPVFGWEGAGIEVVTPDLRHRQAPKHTSGQAIVYQEWTPLGTFGGAHPVWGTWVVGGRAAGLGIRESGGPVTDTGARFVPHYLAAPRSTPDQIAQWLRE